MWEKRLPGKGGQEEAEWMHKACPLCGGVVQGARVTGGGSEKEPGGESESRRDGRWCRPCGRCGSFGFYSKKMRSCWKILGVTESTYIGNLMETEFQEVSSNDVECTHNC